MGKMIGTAISFIKGHSTLFIIMGVLAVIATVAKVSYQAGADAQAKVYLEAQAEMQHQWDAKLKAAVKEAKEEAAKEHELAMETIRNENRISNESREVEREVFRTDFVCTHLGDEFKRLFNCGIQTQPGCIDP